MTEPGTDREVPLSDLQTLRQFAFTMAGMIAVVFALLLPFVFDYAMPWWPWVLALLLLACGVGAPAALRLPYRWWMRLAMVMNRITTPLILGLVFFIVLTPTGWLMRRFARKSMTLDLDNSSASYRISSRNRAREDMEKPF